jgi:glutamate-1-semialdehyde 2,1-aminomutase
VTHLTEGSRELFDRALGVMVEGVSSPSRGPANYGAYPLFMERGDGSKLYDVDGNAYVDWMMAYGALPFGHAHPVITQAICEAAQSGALYATATEIEVRVAELLVHLLPSAERIRFANTGTEAAMAAIRVARGFTGRPKLVKFEGHYHGWYDDVLLNVHPRDPSSLGHQHDPIRIAESSGLNRHALDDTIVVPWNDLAAVERVVAGHPGQIAAILTEGIMANMGVVPPEPEYLPRLQALARANDILFVLDETVTGFRIGAGGCQRHYDLAPDLTIFGKALGAGLPVAALAGRADVMDALSWGGVLHYGTQNASRIGLHAAHASLRLMTADDGAYFRRVWEVADELGQGLERCFGETRTPAVVQRVGPMLQIMFAEGPIRDYRDFCRYVDRDRYRRFALALFEHGVYMTPSAALHSVVTGAHAHDDVALTLDAVTKVLT